MSINENEYLSDLLKIRHDIKDGNSKWDDINNLRCSNGKAILSTETLRKGTVLLDEFDNAGWVYAPQNTNIPNYKETTEYNSNGNLTSDKVIELKDCDKNNPNALLKAHGFNKEEFELVSAKNSIWNQNSKENGITNLYASKITVKPRSKNEITFDDIEDYFETKKFKTIKELTKPTNYDPSGEILEVTLPDLHAGLFAWEEETGNNYDIHIAKENFLKCFNDIIERSNGRKFKKILFVTLGDLLHVDNDAATTTKGTAQQIDGRITKVYNIVLDMLIDAIEILGNFAPVEVIYTSGNHDALLGFTLIKSVEKAFRNDENITFDNSPNPRKYKKFGNVLLGWLHGDVNEKNISEWLQVEARKEFGETLFAEVHAGHRHHQQTIEKNGMIVRYLPTICASSAWEHSMAFNKNVKTVISFVWNEKCGLRDMWFSNI